MRIFYTRKIEDLQRRAEQQIRAIKRGSSVGVEGALPALDADGEDRAQTAADGFVEPAGEGDAIKPTEAVGEMQQRMEAMESELLATAEELGRTRKLLASLQQQEKEGYSTSVHANPQSVSSTVGSAHAPSTAIATTAAAATAAMAAQSEAQEAKTEARALRDEIARRQREWEAASARHEEKEQQLLRELLAAQSSTGDQRAQAEEQREQLRARLREEEARCAHLAAELALSRLLLNQPRTPQMEQFTVKFLFLFCFYVSTDHDADGDGDDAEVLVLVICRFEFPADGAR